MAKKYSYHKLSGHTKKAAAKAAAKRARKTYKRVRVTGKTGAWKVMVNGRKSARTKAGSCAVMLGSRGGKKTARRRKSTPAKRKSAKRVAAGKKAARTRKMKQVKLF